jgi:hypothetical protein
MAHPPGSGMDRRRFIQGTGASLATALTAPWSHASRPHGADERVQRITENLIRRSRA